MTSTVVPFQIFINLRCSFRAEAVLAQLFGGSKYPRICYLGFWEIVIVIQVLGRYMMIGYLDP